MSQRVKKLKNVASDVAQESDDTVSDTQRKRKSRAANNDSAKSKLAVVIDILTFDDQSFTEQTMRHNVQIALKHLHALQDML
jgi:hypothetical protein